MSKETLAFLFTDIEGSTALLGRLGEGTYADVLAEHHRVIRSGRATHDGKEVGTQGDRFFAMFSTPSLRDASASRSLPWSKALDRLVRGLAGRGGVVLTAGAAAHAFRHHYGVTLALRGVINL